jgi:uncharacterized protein involved in exopolysaccharide biosynthesis
MLMGLLNLLWLRKTLASAIIITFVLLGTMAAVVITPRASVTARLILEDPPRSLLSAHEVDPGRIQNEMVRTERDAISAVPLLEEMLSRSPLSENPVYRSAALPLKILLERLTITASRDSWTVTITLQDEDPERARGGLHTLLDAYARSQRERGDRVGKIDIATLTRQAELVRQRIIEDRKAEADFSHMAGLFGSQPDDSLAMHRLHGLTIRRALLDVDVNSSQALINQADEAMRLPSEDQRLLALEHIRPLAQEAGIPAITTPIHQAEGRIKLLLKDYLDGDPRITEARAALAYLQRQRSDALLSAKETLAASHKRLLSETTALESLIATEQSRVAAEHEQFRELAIFRDATKSDEALHGRLLARMHELAIDSASSKPALSVLDQPIVTHIPSLWIRPLGILAALLTGLIVSLMVIPLIEPLRNDDVSYAPQLPDDRLTAAPGNS